MSFTRQFSRGELKLGRVEAFSDGVFTIIVTLLVLELKVPVLRHGHDVHELSWQLMDMLPKLMSWLISFFIVCKFWLNHHHILGLARHANYGMVWLNAIFLMAQAFVPFPAALMGEYPENPLAVSCFGAVMAVNTLLFMMLHAYILRNLLKPELAPTVPSNIMRKSLLGPLAYLLGAGMAWFSAYSAFVIYLVTPLIFITPAQNAPQPKS